MYLPRRGVDQVRSPSSRAAASTSWTRCRYSGSSSGGTADVLDEGAPAGPPRAGRYRLGRAASRTCQKRSISSGSDGDQGQQRPVGRAGSGRSGRGRALAPRPALSASYSTRSTASAAAGTRSVDGRRRRGPGAAAGGRSARRRPAPWAGPPGRRAARRRGWRSRAARGAPARQRHGAQRRPP